MKTKQIRIGSRESRLAVIQSEIIIDLIRQAEPDVEIEMITMKTTGDMILDKSLEQIGGKGLFVKELDLALMEGRCDLTVHSLKDMPMELPKQLPILAYSAREDERDVLILRKGLEKLPENHVIGTGSKRRILQASPLFPQAVFKGIRGNLVTRLKKLDAGEYDALILAAAGVIRMGLQERISRFFSVEEMIPSAGQGIMAVQGLKSTEGEMTRFLHRIGSEEARIMALAERSFVRVLDGGCSSPIAACARIVDDHILLRGLYYEEATGTYATGELKGAIEEPEGLGVRLAMELKGKAQHE